MKHGHGAKHKVKHFGKVNSRRMYWMRQLPLKVTEKDWEGLFQAMAKQDNRTTRPFT